MSLKEDYESFFLSESGYHLLTWLADRRISEHDKAENNPSNASEHASAARAFKEVTEHIDSVRTGMGRSSSGEGSSSAQLTTPLPLG